MSNDTDMLRHEMKERINATNAPAQPGMEAEHKRYTNLYDLAPVGYLNLAANGAILLVNLAAAALVGCTRAELRALPKTVCFKNGLS